MKTVQKFFAFIVRILDAIGEEKMRRIEAGETSPMSVEEQMLYH